MKIIFFDIDGTLLPSGTMKMCESTKEAIRRARANGHICMINTGRTKRTVGEELTSQVEFDGYLMGCGTMIEYHNEILLYKTLSPDLSNRVLDALKRYKIDALLEGSRENYSEIPEKMHTETFRNYAKGYQKMHYKTLEDASGNYDKLFLYVNAKEDLEGFYREFSEELDFIDREEGFYEVVPKGYSKATAIRYITEKLGLSMEDTVAIGDSNNDMTMMTCVNTAIAMGNSTQAILDIAHHVTTCVDNDGIWNALEWLGVLV